MKSFFCFLSLSFVFLSSTACAASAENLLSADDIKQLPPLWYTRKRVAIGGAAFFLGLGGAIGFPFLRRFIKKKGFSAKILNALTAAAIASGVIGVAGLVPLFLRARLWRARTYPISRVKSDTIDQLERKGDAWIRYFQNYGLLGLDDCRFDALALRNAADCYGTAAGMRGGDVSGRQRAEEKKNKAWSLAQKLYPIQGASPTN